MYPLEGLYQLWFFMKIISWSVQGVKKTQVLHEFKFLART